MNGGGADYRVALGGPAREQDSDLLVPEFVSTLRNIAALTSVLATLISVTVLIGWSLDIESLKRLVPGLTTMNPTTAIGFVCSGCALGLLATQSHFPLARRLAIALGGITAALGAVRVCAIVGIGDLGVDRLLVASKLLTADFGRPDQMAPNTAVNFLLIGSALTILDRPLRRFGWGAQLLALTAAMTSLLAVMGYAYGMRSFYGIGSQMAMAFPIAVMFLVMAIGVLCARPAHGIMAVVASDSSGGAMIRRLLPAVIVIPGILGALRLAGRQSLILDTAAGLWLLIISIMTIFAMLVAWNAMLLYRMDLGRAASERKLSYLAEHDALTELPNRRLFLRRLAAEIERRQQDGPLAAVLFVDLDLFKVINDSLGHVVGDETLIAAGRRVGDCVGPDDIVARLGGDEFTVLLTGLEDTRRATDVAELIRTSFERPFTVGLHEVFTSVSIGVAFAQGTDSAQDVLRHADIAMYHAKARGRSRYEVFDGAMDLAARTRQQLEYDLRRAIQRHELRVYYQPEVEIETGRLVGMEALVRWEHPQRGLISPAGFLSVAEETGLIVPIGRWVLLEACRQARLWQTQYGDVGLMVSVNLSGKHLQQATLIDEVQDVLVTTGLDPHHLIIEITETVAMAGAETTIEILSRLKAIGVQLAIDDFGTGFSSLAYLKRFPVDLLKIDKSFVDGVANNGHDTAIVEAIIALGHALDLRVIAEGVERPEQLQQLRSLGSELGQGYFFGKPLAGYGRQGMPSLLQAHQRWAVDRGGAN
jgi:diguanylate cyclase (GGDEF)-like protein